MVRQGCGKASRPAAGTTSRLPSFIGQWGYFWPSTLTTSASISSFERQLAAKGITHPSFFVTLTTRPRAMTVTTSRSSSPVAVDATGNSEYHRVWTFPTPRKGQDAATPVSRTWERLHISPYLHSDWRSWMPLARTLTSTHETGTLVRSRRRCWADVGVPSLNILASSFHVLTCQLHSPLQALTCIPRWRMSFPTRWNNEMRLDERADMRHVESTIQNGRGTVLRTVAARRGGIEPCWERGSLPPTRTLAGTPPCRAH